jgi:hypothetical protein
MEPGLSGRAARLLLGVAILTALVALRFNRIFLTFDAASNQQNPKQPMPINNLETHWQKPRG